MDSLRALARRVDALPLWVLPLALGVAVIFVPQALGDYSIQRQMQLSLILCLLVSGLNLSLGYAGELALGQVAMFAGGAYAAGLLSTYGHTDIVLQLLVAGLVAVAVGIITGVPGLRLNSWSLAMTSFFLVLLLPDVISIFKEETGGRNGLVTMHRGTLLGEPVKGDAYFVVIAVVTLLWFVVMRNIIVSRHGTALRVLKQSPVLAQSVGISVFRMKLLAYALGSVPAGLAGALFANLDLFLSPEAFSFTYATTILAASIVGGSASVYGAVVGAVILQFGLNQSSDYTRYSLVITGSFLLICGVLLPGGLASLARAGWRRLVGRREVDMAAVRALSTGLPKIAGQSLRVEQVTKSFGGNRALAEVDLEARPGRVTALIGPNGSGKTTLLNVVCGFYRPDAGAIHLGNVRIDRMAPHRVARAGVTRTFQTPNIPPGITVLEAVIAGRYMTRRVSMIEAVLRLPRFWRVRREDEVEAWRALDLVGIAETAYLEATSLPLGQRRLLEVARCLVARPGLLLLDEVASGLDEDEVARLRGLIRRVADAGATVLLVEHNFQLVLDLADEIVALAHGSVMARGTPEQIANDPRVLSEYLGVEPSRDDGEASVLSRLMSDSITGGDK
ncbi:MAG: branched-chain amino acid ABC transporter ATP-binding protein/permease [Micromonosporaceae bacterium]|nr:branched-chain amino acid ABC transporter ATP-binding protein/permease [Micromonosporaceae bacterium]